ncbi:MAG: bacteriocin fulvocin C-related protein [Confluentibacter sp.]|nr:bacteriocin fulvocin C-related protein [Confluentibacter sp.]
MKSIIQRLLYLSFTVAVISCSTNDEVCYSCNESVNEWAHENIVSIQAMDRQAIVSLPGEKQRAAFRVQTPEKRKLLWKNKLSQLLNEAKSKEEEKLILFVDNFASKLSFDRELTDREYYDFEKELLPLVEKSGWTKSEMVYAFGTLQNGKKKIKNDFFAKNSSIKKLSLNLVANAEEDPDCNCKWGWCGDGSDCEDDDCEETNLGCGAIWLGSCTKICGGNPN